MHTKSARAYLEFAIENGYEYHGDPIMGIHEVKENGMVELLCRGGIVEDTFIEIITEIHFLMAIAIGKSKQEFEKARKEGKELVEQSEEFLKRKMQNIRVEQAHAISQRYNDDTIMEKFIQHTINYQNIQNETK